MLSQAAKLSLRDPLIPLFFVQNSVPVFISRVEVLLARDGDVLQGEKVTEPLLAILDLLPGQPHHLVRVAHFEGHHLEELNLLHGYRVTLGEREKTADAEEENRLEHGGVDRVRSGLPC